MAYSLDGSTAYLRFSIGNLQPVDAGPSSIAILCELKDATNGALFQLANAGLTTSYTFMETFGVLNYGHQTVVRAISSANLSALGLVSAGFVVLGGGKGAGGSVNPNGHYGAWALGTGALTHFTAASTMTDGGTTDATSIIQIGQYLAATGERANINLVCAAYFTRELTNTEWDTLASGDWDDWVAMGAQWLIRCDNIATLQDQVGNGHETARFGTITLVADPVNFFPSSSTPINDSDSASVAESGETIRLSNTDSGTLSEAQQLRLSNTDSTTLSEAQQIRLSSTDSSTLSETERIRPAHTDTGTLDDTVVRIRISDTDTLLLSEGNAVAATLVDSDSLLLSEANGIRISDTDALALTEAQRSGLVDVETFTLGDTTYRVRLTDIDTATLGEVDDVDIVGGGGTTPSSADIFTLTEAERIHVRDTDSLGLSDVSVTVRVSDADVLTLTDALIAVGLSYNDAFGLAETAAAIASQVGSTDSFTLVEAQAVSGDGGPVNPSSPITIQIGTPAIIIRLGVPQITIGL
jgi:hypothetical protein